MRHSDNTLHELTILLSGFLETSDLQGADILRETSFRNHLGMDSFSRAEFLETVQIKYKIKIEISILNQIDSLEDVIQSLDASGSNQKKQHIDMPVLLSQCSHAVNVSHFGTLNGVLVEYGSKDPSRLHAYLLNDQGQEIKITYGALYEKAKQVVYSLRLRKIHAGDTVAIILPTSFEFLYTFVGILLAGGIPVPLYPPYRLRNLPEYIKQESQILNNANATLLITFDQAEKLKYLLKGIVPSLREVVDVKKLGTDIDSTFMPHIAKKNDLALIQYTSGSTSTPKGVALTHSNLLANIRAYGEAIQVGPTDRMVSWLPLYHDLGLIGAWLGSLYFGVPLILFSPLLFLNKPEQWLWAIHRYQGTISAGPNFAYERCVQKIQKMDPVALEGLNLSSWRIAINGAENVRSETAEKFYQTFKSYGLRKHVMRPVYGLAESSLGLTVSEINSPIKVDYIKQDILELEHRAEPCDSHYSKMISYVSCGKPMTGHSIRIASTGGEMLTERLIGHVQFKGPSAMEEYYRNPVESNRIFHDGWWDTGDLGYLFEGELYITGRSKDLIIKGGRNYYPSDIEGLLQDIPDIRRGCVVAFGTLDEKTGTEKIVVVAELKRKKPEDKQKIRRIISERIMHFMDIAPDEVILVSPHSIPKTSSGKLRRSACRENYLSGKSGGTHHAQWFSLLKAGLLSVILPVRKGIGYAGKIFYTAYVALIALITISIFFPLLIILPQRTAGYTVKIWAKITAFLALGWTSVTDKAYLKNLKRPIIFAVNHTSYLDGFFLLGILPANVRFIGKKELFEAPFIGIVLKRLNYLSVDRNNPGKKTEFIEQIRQTLGEGKSLVIFPEGTFDGHRTGLHSFRNGVFVAAATIHSEIIPMALHGVRKILQKKSLLLSWHPVKITVSRPVSAEGDDWENISRFKKSVWSTISKHCG